MNWCFLQKCFALNRATLFLYIEQLAEREVFLISDLFWTGQVSAQLLFPILIQGEDHHQILLLGLSSHQYYCISLPPSVCSFCISVRVLILPDVILERATTESSVLSHRIFFLHISQNYYLSAVICD